MNTSTEFAVSAPSRILSGLRICDLGWNAALGFTEGLLSLPGNRTTLAFLDERTLLRSILDPGHRIQLDRRLLLPGGGRILAFLANRRHERSTSVRFSAATFVPALLTFLEKRCRIGFAGEDAARIECLRDHFARHSPWHDMVAISPPRKIPPHLDVVIIDAGSFAEERRVEEHLSALGAGLVIMAGSGLSGFVKDKPAVGETKIGGISAAPSFS